MTFEQEKANHSIENRFGLAIFPQLTSTLTEKSKLTIYYKTKVNIINHLKQVVTYKCIH